MARVEGWVRLSQVGDEWQQFFVERKVLDRQILGVAWVLVAVVVIAVVPILWTLASGDAVAAVSAIG